MRSNCKLMVLVGLGAAALPLFGSCGPTLAQFHAAMSGGAAVSGASATSKSLAQDSESWNTDPRDRRAADGSQDSDFLNADPLHASIVGLWHIQFFAGDQLVDEGFDAWHGDQTEILNDTPPPVTGNVCLGAWTQTGRDRFKLKHPSWVFDEATNTQVTGQAIIREEVRVGRDGGSFFGKFTVDVIDTSGNLLEHIDGHVKATRIRVD